MKDQVQVGQVWGLESARYLILDVAKGQKLGDVRIRRESDGQEWIASCGWLYNNFDLQMIVGHWWLGRWGTEFEIVKVSEDGENVTISDAGQHHEVTAKQVRDQCTWIGRPSGGPFLDPGVDPYFIWAGP